MQNRVRLCIINIPVPDLITVRVLNQSTEGIIRQSTADISICLVVRC